jgi:hypothetical protein
MAEKLEKILKEIADIEAQGEIKLSSEDEAIKNRIFDSAVKNGKLILWHKKTASSKNMFSGDEFLIRNVIPFLRENKSIVELNLRRCDLKEISIIAVLSLKEITNLNCSENSLCLTEAFGYLIENDIVLKTLNLDQEQSVFKVIKSLSLNKGIIDLSISLINLKNDDAIKLSENDTLKKLNIRSSRIGRNGILALCKIKKLNTLVITADVLSMDFCRNILNNDRLCNIKIMNDFENMNCSSFLRKIPSKKIELHKKRVEAFLFGSLPTKDGDDNPPILTAFYKNKLYDKRLVKEITSFIEPVKMNIS